MLQTPPGWPLKIAASVLVEGFDSLNNGTVSGATVGRTVSNHQKTAVDAVGSDAAEKARFKTKIVITTKPKGVTDSHNEGCKAQDREYGA